MRRCALTTVLILACLAWLGGCGPSRDGFDRVYTGMLQEQVYNIMGAPKNFDPKQWVYEPGLFNPVIVIDFVDGRVTHKAWGGAPDQTRQPSTEPAPRTN